MGPLYMAEKKWATGVITQLKGIHASFPGCTTFLRPEQRSLVFIGHICQVHASQKPSEKKRISHITDITHFVDTVFVSQN